jgi:hypothetical protein
MNDALEHLRKIHTKSGASTGASPSEYLRHWIVSTSDSHRERRNEKLSNFVMTIHQCTQSLLGKAIDIRSSVVEEDKTKGRRYLLPTALVKAAERTFQYIYFSAHSLQTWHEGGIVPPVPDSVPMLLDDNTEITGVEYFAKAASNAMSEARDELMLLAHTGESRDPVLHIRTTPESSVLCTLLFLLSRRLLHGLEVDELYQEDLVRLVSSVNHKRLCS